MTYLFKCANDKCDNHGKETEVVLSMKDTIKASCKVCNNEMKRVYTSPAICTEDGVKSWL